MAAAVLYLGWLAACAAGNQMYPWDDNYISYTYSRNLAQGDGLRYNAVDSAPTEGFSSLSHVLFVALADRLRIDPLAATVGASLLFFVLIPLLVGFPLAALLEVSAVPVLAICYAGQILYFLSPGTIFNLVLGMETIIFMGGLAALAGWSIGEIKPGRETPRAALWRAVLGCLATTMVALGRPEGPIIVVLTLGVVFLARRLPFPESQLRSDRPFLLVAAFATSGIIAYFLWKLVYFGYLLPNPYYVKSNNVMVSTKSTGFPGWHFTKEFLGLIWPWVAAGIPLFFLAGRERTARNVLLAAVLPGAAIVLAYAKAIHEAAFWYRYEFPYLAYLHLLLAGLVCIAAKRFHVLPLASVAAAVLCVTALPANNALLRKNPLAFLDVRIVAKNSLEYIGQDLARTGLGQRATIALTAAGAIPYFSGFRAIDMVGLNNNFLSGRTPHSIAEAWDYIDGLKPDVIQSGWPPATPGITMGQYDPVFGARVFAPWSYGEFGGNELPKYFDRGKVLESMRREMILLRDRYMFGAAYPWPGAWQIVYIRRDSPYRTKIKEALRISPSIDRWTDLRPFFVNDPRLLGSSEE